MWRAKCGEWTDDGVEGGGRLERRRVNGGSTSEEPQGREEELAGC